MVRDCPALRKFEREWIEKTPHDVHRNFAIVDALYEEALHLGVARRQDPLEGIETIIRVASVVNSVESLLARLATALDDAGIAYMVIGGQAV
jgi:hypothetical protein